MMMPLLACVALGEGMSEREWVRSDQGIRKEEDELRLDSWIQVR